MARVVHTIETEGNYTMSLVKMEVVIHDIFRLPREKYALEAPPNASVFIHIGRINYTEVVRAFHGTKDVFPYRLLNLWDFMFLVPMAYGAVMATVRRLWELLPMANLTAALIIVYFVISQLLGWRPSTLIAYLALAVSLVAVIALARSGDWATAALFTAAFVTLASVIITNTYNIEAVVLALSAASIVAIKGCELLAMTPLAARYMKCRCRGDVASAKREAYRKAETAGAGRRAAEVYIRELARLCKIRTFARSLDALALCMAGGGVISWRLYLALRGSRQEEVAEALRTEAL